MNLNKLPGCCGLRELHGLANYQQNPEGAYRALLRTIQPRRYQFRNSPSVEKVPDKRWRHLIFAQANNPDPGLHRQNYGEQFAEFLRGKGFSVVETVEQINPNSGNKLKAWIATVDWDTIEKDIQTYLGDDKPIDLEIAVEKWLTASGYGKDRVEKCIKNMASPFEGHAYQRQYAISADAFWEE